MVYNIEAECVAYRAAIEMFVIAVATRHLRIMLTSDTILTASHSPRGIVVDEFREMTV